VAVAAAGELDLVGGYSSSPSTSIGDGCRNGTGVGGGKMGAAVEGAFGGDLTSSL
jgi:hypothetical protein